MAAVANTAARIWYAGASALSGDPVDRLHAVNGAATRLLREASAAAERMFEHSSPFLSGTLYTLSRSGTVEAVLRRMGREALATGEPRHIFVSESRPGGEGVATSRMLAGASWQVTLVPDTASGLFIYDAAAVVFGADSVRADGSVVNKAGSFPLALMAQHAGVPVYALSETIKVASPDFPLHFEEGNARELLPEDTAGVTPRAPAFDCTPPDLITTVITECGPLSREEIARLAEEARTEMHVLLAP
jgi:translation initiation factor 2B subunit (eIF-2B alpha/beta/delta family)